jgi:hypothetical protein
MVANKCISFEVVNKKHRDSILNSLFNKNINHQYVYSTNTIIVEATEEFLKEFRIKFNLKS